MRVIGSMIRQKGTADILIWMVQNMRDSGEKINSMARVKSHGLMVLCMRVIMYMAKSMVSVNLDGRMAQLMKANSKTIILRVRADIFGLMEDLIQVLGSRIKCMVAEYSLGQMVENTKVNM